MGAALPCGRGRSNVDSEPQGCVEDRERRPRTPMIDSARLAQRRWEGTEHAAGRLVHGGGRPSRDCRGEQDATRPFDVRREGRRVAPSDQGIPFPLSDPSATGHNRGTLRHADAAVEPRGARPTPIARAVTTTVRPETPIPDSATCPVSRNPMVEGLMADPQGGIAGDVQRKPMGHLLGRPPRQQVRLDVCGQRWMPSGPARRVC